MNEIGYNTHLDRDYQGGMFERHHCLEISVSDSQGVKREPSSSAIL
jgi:hypothetical protein